MRFYGDRHPVVVSAAVMDLNLAVEKNFILI